MEQYRGTTILSVRRNGLVAIGGDGQVTLGNTVMKGNARKVRRLHNDQVIAGFAGGTADAFTLFERFEAKLQEHRGNLVRAAVELARDWRTDRILRRLEALLAREGELGMTTPAWYASLQAAAERIKHDLLHFLITERRSGRTVAGYGAAAKGNTLLNWAGVRADLRRLRPGFQLDLGDVGRRGFAGLLIAVSGYGQEEDRRRSRAAAMPISTRSRTICSTSRPT